MIEKGTWTCEKALGLFTTAKEVCNMEFDDAIDEIVKAIDDKPVQRNMLTKETPQGKLRFWCTCACNNVSKIQRQTGNFIL